MEAETSMKFMTDMFSKHEDSVRKKLHSTFKIYFEDPKMVCRFGLDNVSEKHFGPAESEGYQNLFKHIYTEGLSNNSPPDDVLYQGYLLRKKMALRFYEDYNNSKLPKALEIIKEKYLKEEQIQLEPGKHGRAFSTNIRKSPRKSPKNVNQRKEEVQSERASKKVRRSLHFDQDGLRDTSVMSEQSERERSPSLFRNADADGNIPFVGQTGCSVTQFSKKPRTRDLQRRKLLKKFKDQVDERMEELSAQIVKNRQRYILKDLDLDDLGTQLEENDHEIITHFITTHDEGVEPLSVDDIALVGSSFEPKYHLWESLKAIKLEEDTDFVAEDRYYEVSRGSSIAAATNLFFERCMRSEADKSTTLKKIAFQYIIPKCAQIPYITIVAMTNRGLNGNKYDPFVFQYVLPAARLPDSADSTKIEHLEGVWNVRPEYDSISDARSTKRIMKYLKNNELRNNIVETVTRQYQLEEVITDQSDKDVILGAEGALVNTYAIAEVKHARKVILGLVKIITTGSEYLTVEAYRQSGHSKRNWNKNQSFITKKKRKEIKTTGVSVEIIEDDLILKHTPAAIIKLAEANFSGLK